MSRPWLTLALFFWLGTLIGGAYASTGGMLGLIGFGIATALALRWPRPAMLLGAFAAGAWISALDAVETAGTGPPPASPVAGVVEDARWRGWRIEIVVAPDEAPADRVLVWAEAGAEAGDIARGARVLVHGRLTPPMPADQPGAFDGQAWARRRGIRWIARGPVRLTSAAVGPWAAIQRRRLDARRVLAEIGAPFGAGVLTGVLLGDRAAVPPAAREGLEASGTAHLLAVSGLHIGGLALVVAWFVALAARRALRAYPAAWGAWIALPVALGFVWFAQAPLSACRAGIMVAVALIGCVLGRPTEPLNLLGLAAVGVLTWTPGAAAAPGFQLSFGAVAALVALTPTTGGALVRAVAGACIAAATTAPVLAWHFGIAAPLAPIANLLLVPVAAVVMVPLGAFGLVVSGWTTLPLTVAAHIAELLVAFAEGIAELGGGAVSVSQLAAVPLSAPIVLAIGWRAQRPRLGIAVAAGLVAIALAWPTPSARVEFLAVGQGDAVLLRSGDAAALLDAGPDPDARRLAGVLRATGVTRLERVVVSHAHPDHYAGLIGLVGRVEIGEWIRSPRRGVGPRWQDLELAMAKAGATLRVVGDQPFAFAIGALRVELSSGRAPADWGDNDASLIARVRGPGGDILLLGDIEAQGEQRLVARGIEPALVIKAPHHGSGTSSSAALLDATCPSAVVFTVGAGNIYRFPHRPILERYAERGIDAWRTDLDGRVIVDLDATPRISGHRREGWTSLISRRCVPDSDERAPLLGFDNGDDTGDDDDGKAEEIEERHRDKRRRGDAETQRRGQIATDHAELLPESEPTAGKSAVEEIECEEERGPNQGHEGSGNRGDAGDEPQDQEYDRTGEANGDDAECADDRADDITHEGGQAPAFDRTPAENRIGVCGEGLAQGQSEQHHEPWRENEDEQDRSELREDRSDRPDDAHRTAIGLAPQAVEPLVAIGHAEVAAENGDREGNDRGHERINDESRIRRHQTQRAHDGYRPGEDSAHDNLHTSLRPGGSRSSGAAYVARGPLDASRRGGHVANGGSGRSRLSHFVQRSGHEGASRMAECIQGGHDRDRDDGEDLDGDLETEDILALLPVAADETPGAALDFPCEVGRHRDGLDIGEQRSGDTGVFDVAAELVIDEPPFDLRERFGWQFTFDEIRQASEQGRVVGRVGVHSIDSGASYARRRAARARCSLDLTVPSGKPVMRMTS